MAKQSDFVRYTIRVPADVYEHVARRADENGRSINAEIIERLRTLQGMDDYVPERNVNTDDSDTMEELRRAAKRIVAILDSRKGEE